MRYPIKVKFLSERTSYRDKYFYLPDEGGLHRTIERCGSFVVAAMLSESNFCIPLFQRWRTDKYEFTAKPWLHEWLFVAMPEDMAREIRDNLRFQEEVRGRMKATVKVGGIEWKTAIWFDTKSNTYLLPIKAAIRKKGKVEPGEEIQIAIWIYCLYEQGISRCIQ